MTAFKQISALYNQITNPGLMSIYNNEAIIYTINTDKKEMAKNLLKLKQNKSWIFEKLNKIIEPIS